MLKQDNFRDVSLKGTRHMGIRAWKRAIDRTETVITAGTPVAVAQYSLWAIFQ